jgi:hypothetical protein
MKMSMTDWLRSICVLNDTAAAKKQQPWGYCQLNMKALLLLALVAFSSPLLARSAESDFAAGCKQISGRANELLQDMKVSTCAADFKSGTVMVKLRKPLDKDNYRMFVALNLAFFGTSVLDGHYGKFTTIVIGKNPKNGECVRLEGKRASSFAKEIDAAKTQKSAQWKLAELSASASPTACPAYFNK